MGLLSWEQGSGWGHTMCPRVLLGTPCYREGAGQSWHQGARAEHWLWHKAWDLTVEVVGESWEYTGVLVWCCWDAEIQ